MALVNPAESASAALPVIELLQLIGLGAIVGSIVHPARAIVGLKKLNDAAAGQMPVSEMVIESWLVISFLIDATAGALVALGGRPAR